jgi:hypothetical protein
MTSLLPGDLERNPDFKLVIRDSDFLDDTVLTTALRSAVQRRDQCPDLRWGVVFYSRVDGPPPEMAFVTSHAPKQPDEPKRIMALYFEGRGSRGLVNNIPVTFHADFPHTMRSLLLTEFRRP